MNYLNRQQVNLMLWEVDPKLRKQNNVVKANVKQDVTLQQNDTINYQNNFTVQVLEILETRPAALKGFNNVTFKAKFSNITA